MTQMTLRGWLNLIVLMLLLTTGLGLYVDLKDHELRVQNLEVKNRLQDFLRQRQELSSMLEIAVLDRNILRTADYEKLRVALDATLDDLAELSQRLRLSGEVPDLKDDQERLRIVETKAFELMRKDQWPEARLLLFNEAYVRNAEILEIDTQTAVAAMAGELTAKVDLFDRLRAITLALRLVALALLLWVGARYSQQLRRQLADQAQSQAVLGATQKTLRDLTAHEQAGREAGRKRVAQEIHDELGQRLTVLRMDVALLPRAVAADPAGLLPARVTDLKAGIDGILTIVRDIAGKLRPAALEIGLGPAAEALLQEFRETLGIPCEFDNRLPADLVLDDVRATGVFRILQESLTNIARHAQARHIRVSLSVKSQVLRLRVQDDGQGFTEVANGSFGLPGMRERATSLGGSLRISSAVMSGTTVEAHIPLGVALSPATRIQMEDKPSEAADNG
jgi:signal transduction histidine kinase